MSDPARTPAAPRSLLFVPADRPERVAKALAGGAEAVIVDLEDAVRPEQKEAARGQLPELLGGAGEARRIVRVNDPATAAGRLDLEAAAAAGAEAVMVPKASRAGVATASAAGLPVLALIESAAGLREAGDVAAQEGVTGLALGNVDLGAELGLRPLPGGEELLFARSSLVFDAAAAGLPAFDGVFLDPADEDGLRAEAERSRALGFRGKLCIHPSQLEPVRRAFAPTAAELERARRALGAYEEPGTEPGAIVVDGRMVDEAVLRDARRLLAEAEAEPA
jgi:citrate lyase beta subunit